MSESDERPFSVEIAKQGRAVCKKCKAKCVQGKLRIAKLSPNPFGSGKMKNWHHVNCMFEVFGKQRPTTKRIESPDDVDGWDALGDDDKEVVMREIAECNKSFGVKVDTKTPTKKLAKQPVNPSKSDDSSNISWDGNNKEIGKDQMFREFRRLIADIANVSSYTEKTNFVRKLFTNGCDGKGFKGDIVLWCRLLLPGVVKRVYNLQSRQLTKLFSKMFHVNQDTMLEHFEQGDISHTIQHFFEQCKKMKPAKSSTITVEEVDNFLDELSKLTKEDEQINHFKSFATRCTSNDLKTIVRLIVHDLRMNAGAKPILDGVHPDAYQAYQSSRDIKTVIVRCLESKNDDTKATIKIMTPILPMLAEACKSIEQAMKKCPHGMYSEIKYDGERVQIHKHDMEFKYYSRNLKAVLPHKVAHFKDYIPQAFPHGNDLILDCEILMVDTQTGKPLPFGTLGVHKKAEFKDANVCLFVFDCIYYNGEILTGKPIKHRKKILKDAMVEIPNRIVFSEMEEIHHPDDLSAMIAKVFKLGLEGLVLKDLKSIYEPGKRHWLKVKKDYLFGGAMADTADLIVLGAWYGTGKKGGMMSIFLMGCYDKYENRFCTVTKVHTGHDDKTLEKLQDELDMVKISGDVTKLPNWLNCTKTMIPDLVAKDPKQQPVWEITGAEFTQHDVHTANGISIRFPRVTKIRDDKHWDSATSLQDLIELFNKSKDNTDISLLIKNEQNLINDDGNSSKASKKKRKINSPIKDDDSKKKKQSSLSELVGKAKKKNPKRKLSDSDLVQSKKSKIEPDVGIDDDEDNSELRTIEIRKPMPNYFENVKLLLENGVKEVHAEWIRYFIAYGGVVLTTSENMDATHILHLKDTIPEPTINCSNHAKHIIVEWIKDTVANNALPDIRPYTVRWVPSLKEKLNRTSNS